MKGKYIFLLVASMTRTFVAGVGAHMEYMQIREEKMAEENKLQTAQTENQQEQIEVRILDGYVEWFDGTEWRRTESVEMLQEKDPYYIAKEAFEAFEESYQEELEQENQIALEEASFVMMKCYPLILINVFLHVVALSFAKKDEQFFEALKRHINDRKYYEVR